MGVGCEYGAVVGDLDAVHRCVGPAPPAEVVDADLGRGKVFLMGPEVTMRGQSALSFKFLFNGLYYGPAVAKAAP